MATSLSLLLSCKEAPNVLEGEVTEKFDFNAEERERFQQMQDELSALGDEYIFFDPDDLKAPAHNICFEPLSFSLQTRPVRYSDAFDASSLEWVEEKGILYFGVIPQNWSGRSLNKELIYAVGPNLTFTIFDAQGNELLFIPDSDTLENGEVWLFEMQYQFYAIPKEIGLIRLYRTCIEKGIHEYRILDMRGAPISRWKRVSDGVFDPYFGAFIDIDRKENTATFTSLDNKELYSCTNCKWMPFSTGTHCFIKLPKPYRKVIVNFQSKELEIGFAPNFTGLFVSKNQD